MKESLGAGLGAGVLVLFDLGLYGLLRLTGVAPNLAALVTILAAIEWVAVQLKR